MGVVYVIVRFSLGMDMVSILQVDLISCQYFLNIFCTAEVVSATRNPNGGEELKLKLFTVFRENGWEC